MQVFQNENADRRVDFSEVKIKDLKRVSVGQMGRRNVRFGWKGREKVRYLPGCDARAVRARMPARPHREDGERALLSTPKIK